MYIHTYTCTSACMYKYTYVYICIYQCKYIYIYKCMYIYMHILYICMHIIKTRASDQPTNSGDLLYKPGHMQHLYICTYIYVYTYMYMYIHTYIYTYAYVCIYTCTYEQMSESKNVSVGRRKLLALSEGPTPLGALLAPNQGHILGLYAPRDHIGPPAGPYPGIPP